MSRQQPGLRAVRCLSYQNKRITHRQSNEYANSFNKNLSKTEKIKSLLELGLGDFFVKKVLKSASNACLVTKQGLYLYCQLNVKYINELQQINFNLQMKNAALRQFLRDRAEELTEDEQDEILDELNRNLAIIKELEKL